MEWTIYKQSIEKPDNDIFDNKVIRENEDAINVINKSIFGLSDGAGGVGIFAKEWASTLVDNLPLQPIKSKSELTNWIGTFWEHFYNEKLELTKQDSFLERKFENEGSYATLCCLWMNEKGNEIDYLSYGDSLIFKYNTVSKDLIVQNYFKDFSKLDENPNLLNWKDEVIDENSLCIGEWSINNGDIFFIASDALAHFIYGYYLIAIKSNVIESEMFNNMKISKYLNELKELPLGDFDDLILDLKNVTKTKRAFTKYLKQLWRNKMIQRDDYSLIIIEPKKV